MVQLHLKNKLIFFLLNLRSKMTFRVVNLKFIFLKKHFTKIELTLKQHAEEPFFWLLISGIINVSTKQARV